MGIRSLGIFQLVEIVFFISIIINISSYITGFFIIYRNKHTKAFIQTLKEGWSNKYITQNIASLSMLLTSLTMFWFMVAISSSMKKISAPDAFKINPYITIYTALSCAGLLAYAVFVFMKNLRKVRELCKMLVYLSVWNDIDKYFEGIGGVVFQPFTATSAFIRQHLIKSHFAEVVISAIIWLVGEYIFKISMVLSVLFLSGMK